MTTNTVNQVVLLDVPHQPLTDALHAAALFGDTMPPRYGVQVLYAATRRVNLLAPDGVTEQVLPTAVWQALYPHLQAATAAGWALDGSAIVVDVQERTSAVCAGDAARAFVAAAQHAPLSTSATPSNEAPTAPTLAPPAALVPRSTIADDSRLPQHTLDVCGVLFGGQRPRFGTRPLQVVGFRLDTVGMPVLLDGPGLSTPLTNAEDSDIVRVLLDAALAHDPMSAGVVVDLDTHAVYAVDRLTLRSAVARQDPVQPAPTVLESVVPFAHPLLEHGASVARSYATSPNPFIRTVAAVTCLLSAAGTLFCGWLLYRMGVEPIYQTIRAVPGLSLLDDGSRAVTLTLFGSVYALTVARVLAWMPSLLEAIGILFSASGSWQRILFWTGLTDIVAGGWYYAGKLLPDAAGLDTLMQQYHPALVMLILLGDIVGGLVIGAVSAVTWELVGAVLAVMTIALSPSVPWLLSVLVGGTVRGVARVAISAWYGLCSIGADLRGEVRDRRRGGASVTVVYYDQDNPPNI